MTERQIEKIIKAKGWAYHPHLKGKNKRAYIYAAKRDGSKVVERYVVAASKLQTITQEQVIAKLERV